MRSLVLFCISAKVSGGELYSLQLLGALKQRGWDVSIVGSANPGLRSASELRGIRYVESSIGPKLGRNSAWTVLRKWRSSQAELAAIIRRENPSVVVFQYKLEQMLWAGRRLGPTIAMLEHGPIPKMISRIPFFRRRYQLAIDGADLRFAASDPAAHHIAEWGHSSVVLRAGIESSQRTQAIESALDVRQILEDKLPSCRSIGIYAGRLTEEKGILHAARVISKMPDVGLAIAGAGPCQSALQKLASEHQNITMLGQIEGVLSYIAAADFGVLLTNDLGEGRPLFALECASMGVPLIARTGSPAMDAILLEIGPQAVIRVDMQNEQSMTDAILHVQKFTPMEVSWDGAVDAFTGAIESAP